jgi:hypothetical protein
MRLIDADRLYNTIIDEIDPISISMDGGEMRGMMRTIIAAEPTVVAVTIKDISAWLAAYAAPPKYALDEIARTDPERIITVDTLVKAWEYHWKNLMECGLIGEGLDADGA